MLPDLHVELQRRNRLSWCSGPTCTLGYHLLVAFTVHMHTKLPPYPASASRGSVSNKIGTVMCCATLQGLSQPAAQLTRWLIIACAGCTNFAACCYQTTPSTSPACLLLQSQRSAAAHTVSMMQSREQPDGLSAERYKGHTFLSLNTTKATPLTASEPRQSLHESTTQHVHSHALSPSHQSTHSHALRHACTRSMLVHL